MSHTEEQEAPRQLGRYEIQGRLGEGAMGEVFLALDPQIERQLALKTVKVRAAPGTGHDNLRERLLLEAKAAGRLVHPNVVTLFDAGEDDGTVFLAFEYVEGVHLGERVERGEPLSVAEVLRLVREVASALAAAQARGIVHRDIKPSNILLDRQGTAKIADFGIAKMHDRASDLTVTGAIIGTPHYMSPEQIRAEKLDGRSDVFSLGALLYELIHRTRPFRGDTITTLVYQILHHDPLENLRADLPSALAELTRGMLAKELDERLWASQVVDSVIEIERSLPADVLTAAIHSPFPGNGNGAAAAPSLPPPPPGALPPKDGGREALSPAAPPHPPTVPLPASPPAPTQAMETPPTGGPAAGAAASAALDTHPLEAPGAVSEPAAPVQTGDSGDSRDSRPVQPTEQSPLGKTAEGAPQAHGAGRSRGVWFAVAGCALVGLLTIAGIAWLLADSAEQWLAERRDAPQEESAVALAAEASSPTTRPTDDAGVAAPGTRADSSDDPADSPRDQRALPPAGPAGGPSVTPSEEASEAVSVGASVANAGASPRGRAGASRDTDTEPATRPARSEEPSRKREGGVVDRDQQPPTSRDAAGEGAAKVTATPSLETATRESSAPEPSAEPPSADDAEVASSADTDSWASPVPPDRQMTVGTRLSFRVDPRDAYILFRAVGERRFIQVGQADEHDTSKRRRRAWDLPGPGSYEMILRAPGRRDYLLLLDASGGGESTIEARLQRGQPGGASPP